MKNLSKPTETTVRKLFAASMNRCAFPECTTPVIDAGTRTILAEVCHIHAQRPQGPRFEISQTPSQRHCFDNLILMCGGHHKLIDAPENAALYTASYLKSLKTKHERAARGSASALPGLTPELLRELREKSTVYESHAVHMDFRNAVLRAGGEGGAFGGGGGAGGVITIVGWTRPPDSSIVALNGEDGRSYGAGGGGAGAIQYVGRVATSKDVLEGLRVSSLFPANAASLTGLFNVLGGGWSFCPLPGVPTSCSIHLVCVVEFGTIAPESLIRIQLMVKNQDGHVVANEPQDVAVPNGNELTPRAIVVRVLQFHVDAPGVFTAFVVSADLELASVPIEFRLHSLG